MSIYLIFDGKYNIFQCIVHGLMYVHLTAVKLPQLLSVTSNNLEQSSHKTIKLSMRNEHMIKIIFIDYLQH